jgi:putative ABC transport system permease protein
MKHVGQDFRFAFRSLRKRPGFALLIIATLALCIGANSAIFSIVDAALLHGLPFRDSDRLVSVSEILSSVMSGPIPFSVPDYVQLTQHSRSFEQAGIYDDHGYELSGIGEPQNVHATRISASLFPTLGMSPALGRNFTEQEDTHHHHVAILSGSFWRSKFNADPRILGKTVLLDRIPYTIVGVMAGNTPFPLRGPAFNNEPADLYVPISFTKEELQGWGNMYNNSVIARLRPAVSIGQARAEVKALIHRIYWESYPADHRSTSSTLDADVISLRTEVVGPVEPILLVLFGAVGLVLLIGCADIAGLMLTRAAARTREMSIRAALGATRPDLIRQVLIESVLLAAAGGAAGALVAFWFRDALVRFATVNLPITGSASSSLTLIAFTAALAMLTALLFGIFPALQASLVEVNVGLREGGRGQSLGPKRARVLDALVTAQFALALILLIGAGLLARSFSRLIATNPGFRPDHTLTMSVSLPASAYSKGAQVLAFYERLQGALETTPGVKDAAVATSLPLAINEHRTFAIDGQEPQTLDIPRSVAQIWTLGNFFQTMGIPLERGRLFDRRDSRNSPSVAIINTRLANKFWPGENPLGKRIKWGDNNSKRPWTDQLWTSVAWLTGPCFAQPTKAAIEVATPVIVC